MKIIKHKRNLKEWHKWFAWFPVTVAWKTSKDNKIKSKKIIWFEFVMRKTCYFTPIDDLAHFDYKELSPIFNTSWMYHGKMGINK